MVTVFVKYKEHRDDIQNRIISYYRSGDRGYYATRKVAESSGSSRDSDSNTIHLINQLILELAQCLSTKSMLNRRDRFRQIQRLHTPQPPLQRCRPPISLATSPPPNAQHKVDLFMESIVNPMAECTKFLKSTVYDLINVAKHEKKGTKLALFIKDLENIWDLPMWPVAEYALLITFQLFHAVLVSNTKHSNSKKQEESLKVIRPFVVEGVSSICAAARSAQILGNKKLIKTTRKTDTAPTDGNNPCAEGEVIDCKCGDNRKLPNMADIFMMDCDDCHSWSHGICAGFKDSSEMPSHWICDSCTLNREIEEQLVHINAKHGDEIGGTLDQSTKLHILLINYLSKQLPMALCTEAFYIPTLSSHPLSARQFHLMQWLYRKYEADQKAKKERKRKLQNAKNSKNSGKNCGVTMEQHDSDSEEEEEKPRRRTRNSMKRNVTKSNVKSNGKSKVKTKGKRKKTDKMERDDTEDDDVDMDQNLIENEEEKVDQELDHLMMRLFEDYFIMPQASQLKSLPTFSEKGIHGVNMQLALDRELIGYHSGMIFFLSSDLMHPQSKVRTKALKSLREISDIDSFILKDHRIRERVIHKFRDKSPLVREAAVDLVGKHVIHDASLIGDYFDDLERRIQDTSVAVRKRVIRIFKEICLTSPDNPKRQEICLSLFSRMKEANESILKLVSATFEELWFSNSETIQNRVATKGEYGGEKVTTQSVCAIRECEQFIGCTDRS